MNITVIGCGRVGLPLALSLREAGMNVNGVDVDTQLIDSVLKKVMPFKEPGYDELIKDTFSIYNSKYEDYPESDVYIITVGTPLRDHIETNLTQVTSVMTELISKVDIKNKLIILRSTVAPKTTEYIKNMIEVKTNYKTGVDFFLAMCPERIVEGKAYEELLELPQIIGVDDDISYEKAEKVFSVFKVLTFKTTFIEAELSKLFTNIYRYINFSIPNYFAYLADYFDVDIYHLLKVMKTNYSRNNGLLSPGFTGGSCLRKDFGMINECFPQTDLILQAYKINEFMPKFYVDLLKDNIKNNTVGVLGYTFKCDTDDTRDNLTPKLIRYLNRNSAKEVKINDPNLKVEMINDIFNHMQFNNYSIEEVIQCDIVILAVNHKEYNNLTKEDFKGKIVIDGWGILNENLYNDWRN